MQSSKITFLRKYQSPIVAALLGLVTLSFYWQATGFEFINFDDPTYVTSNRHVLSGLRWEAAWWAFSTNTIGHWHPLTWLAHMADVSLFGLQPWGHHLSNILLFSAGVSLVFFVLRFFKIPLEWAFLATLFFALHPMRLESVVWVSEKKDVLSFLFGMASLLSYLRVENERKRLIYSALFLFLSLLAKPSFVVLPLLLFLYEIFMNQEKRLRVLASRLAPLFVLATLSCFQVLFTQKSVGAVQALGAFDRLEMFSISLMSYFGKFFLGFEGSIFHPRKSYDWGVVAGGLVMIAGSLILVFSFRKKRPFVSFCGFWFFIAALPFSGIIPIGGQMYADRWTLIPHVGLTLLFASVLSKYRFFSLPGYLSLAFVLATAAYANHELPNWKDSETVFRQSLDVEPDNFMAHTNLGSALVDAGRADEAAEHFERASQLSPGYAPAISNLGLVRARQGRLVEASKLFERSLKLNPNLVSARYNWGLSLFKLGRFHAALEQWLRTLQLDPHYELAANSLLSFEKNNIEQCREIDLKALASKFEEAAQRNSFIQSYLGRLCLR